MLAASHFLSRYPDAPATVDTYCSDVIIQSNTNGRAGLDYEPAVRGDGARIGTPSGRAATIDWRKK